MNPIALTLLVFCSPQQPSAPAPADRSGEPALRRVFEAAGKVKTVHATIHIWSTDSIKAPMYPAGDIDFYYDSPKKVRLAYSDYWGGSALVVADGSTVMMDGMDDSSPIVLQDEGKTGLEATPDLTENGSYSSPLIYLLKGSAAFETLVSKSGKIVDSKAPGGLETFEFESPIFGQTKLFVSNGKSGLLPVKVEFDNMAYYRKQNQSAPEWNPLPEAPLTRHEITYQTVNKGISKSVFDVRPAKGKTLTDNRKAKKPPRLKQDRSWRNALSFQFGAVSADVVPYTS